MEDYRQKTHIALLVQPDKLLKPAHTMPPPAAVWLFKGSLYIARFDIDGYFTTKRGIEFLNDAIARFIQTFGREAVKPAPIPQQRRPDIERDIVLHLQEFVANLESLKQKTANKAPTQLVNIDETFWAMKLWFERQLSQNRIPSETELQAVGQMHAPHKESSTIRAKARSIYRWYAARGFEPTKDTRKRTIGDEPMTRQEAARIATQTKVARVKSKIEAAVNILKMQNKRISCRSIAEAAQISRNTAAKYLRELRTKGVI